MRKQNFYMPDAFVVAKPNAYKNAEKSTRVQ